MDYEVRRTNKFKKEFCLCIKRGLDISKFEEVLVLLKSGSVLPERYQDHPLKSTNEFKDCRELHIEPDWLLIYKYYKDNLVLYLLRTGSHSDLFK